MSRGILTRLTQEEERDFEHLIRELSHDPRTQRMRDYVQHGAVRTFDHCMDVTRCAFKLNRRLRVGADEKILILAAFLHDYYLYDWHSFGDKLHGYHHPHRAAENARRDFDLPSVAVDAIRTHMWPLTMTHVPKSRIAWLVTLADKACSTRETLFARK